MPGLTIRPWPGYNLAALDDILSTGEWLDLALPPVLEGLRRRGARELAWMDYWGWAGSHLGARGFDLLAEVATMIKFDRVLPDIDVAGARLRPAADADRTVSDIPATVAIDRAAFPPIGGTARPRYDGKMPSHLTLS